MADISDAIRASSVKGPVIMPGDPDFDIARKVFPGGFDKKPAAIIQVSDAEDIASVIRFARDSGTDISIKSGGHGGAGHCISDGGIVIDLSRLRSIDIDPSGKYAWAETGMTACEYTKITGAQKLATGFGDTGSVGIGGITLGGGIGYLVRKFGLTIDDVLAADIVTADGRFLRTDAMHHPDLFWALRGGGGNFGVVTRFKYRLHPLDTVIGGMMVLPATAETITAFAHRADIAPDGLTTIMNIMTAPPMPFVPSEYHGKIVILAMFCFAGEQKLGERIMNKFRSIAPPLVDMIRTLPYPEMYPPEQPDYHPIAANRTLFIDSIDVTTAKNILERLQRSTGTMSVSQIRVLGGAMARIPKNDTAFAHRHSEIMVNLATLYENPEEKAGHEEWVNDFERSVRQTDVGSYVNFLGNDDEARVHSAYPGKTWEKLSAIKQKYDPDNIFHNTQNIPPKKHVH